MKKTTLLSAIALAFTFALQAETVYLNADGNCIDRMEYEVSKAGKNTTQAVFRISPQSDTQLFLDAGSNAGNVLDRLPSTLTGCADLNNWDLNTIQRINTGELTVFIVRQTPQGYQLKKINTAAQMLRKGQEIEYTSSDFDFKANLSYINYGTKLSSAASKSEISMENYAMFDCSSMLSLRQSPSRSDMPQNSFQFVPELGITSVTYGNDAANASHKKQLKSINGADFNQVLADYCRNQPTNTGIVVDRANNTFSSGNYAAQQNQTQFSDSKTSPSNTPTKYSNGGDYIPPNAIWVGHIGLDGVERTTMDATTEAANTVPADYSTESAFIIAPQQTAEVVVETEPALQEVPVEYVAARSIPQEYSIATSNPCGASAETGYHLVTQGETLFGISRKHGVSVEQIKEWNGLSGNLISPCMAIRVSENGAPNPAVIAVQETNVTLAETSYTPAQSQVAPVLTEKAAIEKTDMKWLDQAPDYTVEQGETVGILAKRFGYTEERFRYINGMTDSETLRAGQAIRTTDCNCLRAPQPYEASDAKIELTEKSAIVATPQQVEEKETTKVPKSYDVLSEKGAGIYQVTAVPQSYDVVTIAPQGKLVHVVEKGETIFSLAKRYETTPEKIYTLNNMEKGEVIIPAMRLYVK